MPAQQLTVLNVQAKLKNSYQLQQLTKANSMPVKTKSLKKKGSSQMFNCIEKYNHILLCKIKDTQIMFSFIIEASLLEQDQSKTPAMS